MEEQRPDSLNGDLRELREHARSLAANLDGPLRRVSVRSGDKTIEVEWQHVAGLPGPAPAGPREPAAPDETGGGDLLVTSPMVGTFYRAPEPGSPPFVDVGDDVKPGQTVAIVEAMKLFNPVASDHAGVVTAVLADNGQPVEFGQPLLSLSAAAPADAGPDERE